MATNADRQKAATLAIKKKSQASLSQRLGMGQGMKIPQVNPPQQAQTDPTTRKNMKI